MEMEMAKDPFLEAGIAIPAELPYQDDSQRENSARMVLGQFQRLESVIATPASHQVMFCPIFIGTKRSNSIWRRFQSKQMQKVAISVNNPINSHGLNFTM